MSTNITVTSRRSPGEDVVTLLEQPRRQGGVDVGPERRLKSLPLSQTRLHAVERRRQRTQVVVLNHRQTLAEVAGRNTFGSSARSRMGCRDGENPRPTLIGTANTSANAPPITTASTGISLVRSNTAARNAPP